MESLQLYGGVKISNMIRIFNYIKSLFTSSTECYHESSKDIDKCVHCGEYFYSDF